MGWGCGIPGPLGVCVAEFPDINPYVPSLCGPPLDAVAGYPDRPSTGRGIPGPFHIEVWGRPRQGGSPETSTLRCRGLPGRRLMHGCGLPGPCVGV